MMEAVRDFQRADRPRGRASRSPAACARPKQAIQYLVLVHETLGTGWMTPERFRIGASALLNDVLMQLEKDTHRPLRRPRLLHDRLTAMSTDERGDRATRRRRRLGVRARARSRPTSCGSQDRYGLFIDGEFVEPKSGRWFTTINPVDRRDRSPRSRRPAPRTSRRAVEARASRRPRWQALPGSERAKYVFRIARQLQERAREFAVLESMNGGKPIKESRDVDLPLAAAHFFYYAGWADKLEYAFPGDRSRVRSASRVRSSRGTSRC